MANECSICSSDNRAEIDAVLLAGDPIRAVAERFQVTKSAVQRHRTAHMPGFSDTGTDENGDETTGTDTETRANSGDISGTRPEVLELSPVPAPELLGEPGFSVFAEWLETVPGDKDILALTLEVQSAETAAAALFSQIGTNKLSRNSAQRSGDVSAWNSATMALEALPEQIGDAEATRVDANLRFLCRLREFAKQACLGKQDQQVQLKADLREISIEIRNDEAAEYRRGNQLTEKGRSVLSRRAAELWGKLTPFQTAERRAADVYDLCPIRADYFARVLLSGYPQFQEADRALACLSDYGRGLAVDEARKRARAKTLRQVKG